MRDLRQPVLLPRVGEGVDDGDWWPSGPSCQVCLRYVEWPNRPLCHRCWMDPDVAFVNGRFVRLTTEVDAWDDDARV
jgi:hypothetical protein